MRDNIIEQATSLFFEKGFNGVSLQSICSPLKIKPSSLYYHFKGGKEELFVEIIMRSTNEFRLKIESMASMHNNIDKILKEFGLWYINQSPMNMMLIAQIDMPYLSKKSQGIINNCVKKDVFDSLGGLFEIYKSSFRQDYGNDMLVGTLSVLLFSIHISLKMSRAKAEDLVNYNINIFLQGAGPRT